MNPHASNTPKCEADAPRIKHAAIRAFDEQIRFSDKALESFARELDRSGKQLWNASNFGEQGLNFMRRLATSFEEVIPVEQTERTVCGEVEVQTWQYWGSRRVRPKTRWGQVADFVLVIVGCGCPQQEYLRRVRQVTESRTIEGQDLRVPRGPGLTIQEEVTVQRLQSPRRVPLRPTPTFVRFFGKTIASVTTRWLHEVRLAWLRLRGKSADHEYEPRLIGSKVKVSINLPPLRLEDLAPPAQAYWKRRWELEADVKNITGFMKWWNDHTSAQETATKNFLSGVSQLKLRIASLPQPQQTRQMFQSMQQRMQHAEKAANDNAAACQQLTEQMQQLLNDTLGSQLESLGS